MDSIDRGQIDTFKTLKRYNREVFECEMGGDNDVLVKCGNECNPIHQLTSGRPCGCGAVCSANLLSMSPHS